MFGLEDYRFSVFSIGSLGLVEWSFMRTYTCLIGFFTCLGL